MVNFTCPADPVMPKDPVPFISNGNINFKAHDVGWLVTIFFTLVATFASFWLIFKHLTYYTCPLQQRHIVRMLFMVPIYAIVSCFSYLFYQEAIYYQTIRDCYEAVVITSFFYLFLQYLGDTRAEQHAVFKQVKLKKWMWPMGWLKAKPKTGLGFLWVMKICILQYAVIRPVCTLAAVGLQYFGLYCLNSFMPWFGHVWISAAISISVSVAMFCILQFYMPLKKELAPYQPVLKFLAVKSTVFLTFWQDSLLSILVFFKVIKPSQYFSATEVQVGINALLETFEMVIFAFLHIKAFNYRVYRPADQKRTTSRWRALCNVLDFRDWFFEMKDSTIYLTHKAQGRTYSYVEDVRAQKYKILQEAMGRGRDEELLRQIEHERETLPAFWKKGSEKEGQGDDGAHGNDETNVGDLDIEKLGARSIPVGCNKMATKADSRSGKNKSGKMLTNASDSPLVKLEALGPPEGPGGEGEGDEEDGLLEYAARISKLDALLNPESNRQKQHPELTLFHRPPVFDGELGPADPQLEDDWRAHSLWSEVYDIRKGKKDEQRHSRNDEKDEGDGHKRERSWWRSLRDRLSGSWGGEGGTQDKDAMDDAAAEKVPIIQEEEEVDEASEHPLPNARSKEGFVADPSRFAFESPLDALMATAARGEKPSVRAGRAGVGSGFGGTGVRAASEEKPEQAPYFMPLPVSRAVPIPVSVQVSSSAALQHVQSTVALHRNDSLAVQSSKVASLCAYTSTSASQGGPIERFAMSEARATIANTGAGAAPAAQPTQLPHVPTEPSAVGVGSIRWAPQDTPREMQKEALAAKAASSVAGDRIGWGAKSWQPSQGTAVGPKGMKINLVMPGSLSGSSTPASSKPAVASTSLPIAPSMLPKLAVEVPHAQAQHVPQSRPSLDLRSQNTAASPPSRSVPPHISRIEQWCGQAAVIPSSMPIDQRQSELSQPRARSSSQSQLRGTHEQQSQRTSVQERALPSVQPRPGGESAGKAPHHMLNHTETGRARRTSAPPAPNVKVQAAEPQKRKGKDKDRYNTTTDIPAPSQMGQQVADEDPFAAGAHALEADATPEESPKSARVIASTKATSGPKHPHLSCVQAAGGSAFAVGSIVTPRALAQASALPHHHLQQQQMQMRMKPTSPSQPCYGQPLSPMQGSSLHRGVPSPQAAYAHPSIRTSRQASMPTPSAYHRPPALPHAPSQRTQGLQHSNQMHNRYTGEPTRSGRSQPHQQQQDRPPQRPRHSMPPATPAPKAGQFGRIEYID
ncbi:DUF300-domain-containing protein [Tilletiaria anomala UBC 951]|uniref:DUF300-domain-containing protein n=1 Tax=Tilletiaria anomala (strain ATCC 24038 / CBS 436.72 / UBC 951) TaxID=1037660 RepID=A0A066W8H9_TILAU|nr:DUF300-domain-containing protein [Tilletiaria anomala UBC 951]KDN47354.1 DUF300-domain-containing protein [Tilletiaria anomala UBC 951]